MCTCLSTCACVCVCVRMHVCSYSVLYQYMYVLAFLDTFPFMPIYIRTTYIITYLSVASFSSGLYFLSSGVQGGGTVH